MCVIIPFVDQYDILLSMYLSEIYTEEMYFSIEKDFKEGQQGRNLFFDIFGSAAL